ncbi:hypothetical protein [Arthrobacter pascens]|uniref:hypothetical protein n=1 Tax=Arthrobacter pascens TaxID=1677 RepID=UPI001F08DB87|nr:hypothetical protein [Arthrobacter pascens]MDR6558483.1 hypothetical protein [Arthrobacter pascens]
MPPISSDWCGQFVVGLPAEEQGVDAANLLADGSAGLVIGHRRLPATEGKSVRGIFAAARCLVDAVGVTNRLAMMIATRRA